MGNRGRTSVKREKLPALMESYLCVLEGRIPATELRVLLTHGARWSGDWKNYIEGRDAVCVRIEAWLSTVRDTKIKMIRMTDQGDCVKVDFVAHTTLVNPLPIPVELPVMGMYMIEDGKLNELFELGRRYRRKREAVPRNDGGSQ